jgi:hypothetical protein
MVKTLLQLVILKCCLRALMECHSILAKPLMGYEAVSARQVNDSLYVHFKNFPGTDGLFTYTYSPDPYGLMNIICGDGVSLPSYAPGQMFIGNKIQLRPIHSGTAYPRWDITGPNPTPAHTGGSSTPGMPLTIDFYEMDQVQVIDPMVNGVAGVLLYTILPVK